MRVVEFKGLYENLGKHSQDKEIGIKDGAF